MPFYAYSCSTCNKTFKVFHSGDEKQEKCIICKAETLTKQIPTVRTVSLSQKDDSPKQRIEKFIEESRESLKQQKEEAVKEIK